MKQNTATEEEKSKVDKNPNPKLTSLSDLPLWFISSFAFVLVSLASLIYFLLRTRGSKSKLTQGSFNSHHSPEQRQEINKNSQTVQLERVVMKNGHVFSPSIDQPDSKESPNLEWYKVFISRLFPNLTTEQIKIISFFIAGLLLVIAVVYVAQDVFDTTTVGGGLGFSFTLFLVSFVFLYFLYKMNSKARRRQENFSGSDPVIMNAEQRENPIANWFESFSAWSLPKQTPDTIIKETSFSVSGALLALILAYAAQRIFISIGKEEMGNLAWLSAMSEARPIMAWGGIYLFCAVIWAFSAPATRSIDSIINPYDSSNALKKYYSPIRSFFLFTSIGLYFLSVFLMVALGENVLIRCLWVVGLICFILSQLFRTNPHPEAEESPRFQWHNLLILALILGAAFWLRYYQVSIIPADFHNDMAEFGWVARNFLSGIEKNIFGYGFYGIPLMGFLPTAFSMAVFGDNIFGLQMTAVLGGMLNLLAVYLLIWRLFNSHRLAVLTTVLVSINIAHIHFSRIAAYMDPWAFGVFALFLLIDGLKARRALSFGLAGVFLGISMQMYFSGRALIFIICLFLIYAFFFQRVWITQNKRNLLLLVVGVLLAIGPALVIHLTHWSDYIGRSRGVFIFSPESLKHLFYGYNTNSVWVVLLIQIKRSLLMFNETTDTSGQFGYPHPMFSFLISPLIVLGLGGALRRWKNAGMAFMLIWLALLLVLGSILTIDAPFWPRLVGIVPAAAFLAAVALDQILEFGRRIFGAQAAKIGAALTAVFLIAVGYLNWNEYYQVVRDNGSPPAMAGRYISHLPLDITACGIFSEFQFSAHAATTFPTWPRKLVDISPDASDADLNKCTGSSIVWVLPPENIGRLEGIRSHWPDGIVREFTEHGYTMTFYLVGVDVTDFSPIESTIK